ncbi:uncharacterized protein LOC144885904 [Branchiostoma floridae x Branchiostoma japonicum]
MKRDFVSAENPCGVGNNPGCDPDTAWCTVNLTGGAMCVCEKGYKLADDGVSCQDKDECEAGENHCDQLCNNTAGSYTCHCEEGYELTDDPVKPCKDIDECYEGTDNCTVNEICVNVIGTHYCACAPGTSLRNGLCVSEVPAMTTPAMSTEPTTDTTKSVHQPMEAVDLATTESTERPAISKPTNVTTIVTSVLSVAAILTVLALINWRIRAHVKVGNLPHDQSTARDAPVGEEMSEATHQPLEK